MTIRDLQQEFLTSGQGYHLAPEDFFILLTYVTGQSKTFLFTHPEYVLSTSEEKKLRAFCVRRLAYEPIAYIIGSKAFYGRDFYVTRDTLIPRPETEQAIELILNEISTNKQASKNVAIIDIGTGSGNIIVTIVKEIEKIFPERSIAYHASDISSDALTIAKKNAERYAVDTHITFHTGHLLEPMKSSLSAIDYPIIIANLPYLSPTLYQTTSDDIKKFEPRSALVSDQNGLGHIYALLQHIQQLQKQTLCFLEISPEQTLSLQRFVTTLFPRAHFSIHKDLAQQERIVEIRL